MNKQYVVGMIIMLIFFGLNVYDKSHTQKTTKGYEICQTARNITTNQTYLLDCKEQFDITTPINFWVFLILVITGLPLMFYGTLDIITKMRRKL